MTDADVDDIYELRCLLEPEAIGLVAGRAPSARMLAPIRQALEASAVAHRAGDTEAFIAANARFRAAWLALVPNRRLVHAVEMYAGHVRYLRMLTLDNPQMRNLVLRGLREIVAALAASDREAATRAMRRHLDAAKHCFRAAAGLVEREEEKESVS
jgi:DNA-binding GntR family transcriptional regulator